AGRRRQLEHVLTRGGGRRTRAIHDHRSPIRPAANHHGRYTANTTHGGFHHANGKAGRDGCVNRVTARPPNLEPGRGSERVPRRKWWLPPEATPDAAVLLLARGVRAFADGFVSVLLPVYLLDLGFTGFQIGGVATATLIGSSALTLLVGYIAHRYRARPLLSSAALLMVATGAGFTLVHGFWPLLIVAFVGTLNPSSGDVSVFLPLEQS